MKQILLLSTLLLWLVLIGCNPSVVDNEAVTEPGPYADLTGEQVIGRMRSAYQSAATYTDRAVLYVTYRLNGRPIQEPHPWALSYQRDSANFAGQFFDSHVRYNGTHLGCRVFDLPYAQALENQYLLLERSRLPFDEMLTDPIARHVVGGFTELPISTDAKAMKALLPPTIELTTGQNAFRWLARPQKIERHTDQTIEGVVCFHIRTYFDGEPCDFWIEQETGLLHQLLLPNSVLDEKNNQSSEIVDLKLVARFHECRFDQPLDEDAFSVDPPDDAPLVTEFVRQPESFPSELIGRQVPNFELFNPNGSAVTPLRFAGKPTVLLWIAGYGAEKGIVKLDRIHDQIGAEANFGVVYTDADLKNQDGKDCMMSDAMSTFIRTSKIQVPFYYDRFLDASSTLRIKAIPSVLLLDANSKIQLVLQLTEESWDVAIAKAIQRVQEGADLAQESIDDYGRFYAEYRQRLAEVRAPRPGAIPVHSVSAKRETRSTAEVWESNSFSQPGNISALQIGQSARFAVLDGFRTAAILDEVGNELLRKELSLPLERGVTRIRTVSINGKLRIAVFAKMGNQVHWFDERLELVGRFPAAADTRIQITDCQFPKGASGEKLWVALQNGGVIEVDWADGASRKVDTAQLSEFVAVSVGYFGISRQGLVASSLPEFNSDAFNGWQFSKIVAASTTTGETQLCAIGVNADGQWQAIGLDSKLTIQWKADIGGQEFQSDVEPVSVSNGSEGWTVLDSGGGLTLLSSDGEKIGYHRADSSVSGLSMIRSSQGFQVVYSVPEGSVKCIEFKVKR